MLLTHPVRDYVLVLDTDDGGMSTQLLRGLPWEKGGPEFLERILRPEWNIIEMGACLGYYMVLEAKRARRVYAIEADADNCGLLRLSVEANGMENVEVHNLAVSGSNGRARFRPSPGRSDRGRLAADGSVEVRMVTLDSFVEQNAISDIGLLRCDVEGAETGVIFGGQKTLSRMKRGSWIFMDLHPQKVSGDDLRRSVENLMGHGFKPRRILGASSGPFPDNVTTKGFPKVFFEK